MELPPVWIGCLLVNWCYIGEERMGSIPIQAICDMLQGCDPQQVLVACGVTDGAIDVSRDERFRVCAFLQIQACVV